MPAPPLGGGRGEFMRAGGGNNMGSFIIEKDRVSVSMGWWNQVYIRGNCLAILFDILVLGTRTRVSIFSW